jgi:hypothetical protein
VERYLALLLLQNFPYIRVRHCKVAGWMLTHFLFLFFSPFSFYKVSMAFALSTNNIIRNNFWPTDLRARLSPSPALAFRLSSHRHPFVCVPPTSRYNLYNKIKQIIFLKNQVTVGFTCVTKECQV